jgi:hydroxyacyl-ACP dehydratase HTD2-like protein with hotdog domain
MIELNNVPRVGDPIYPVVWRPSTIQLFRFSAVTWNPHRIHFDLPYAETEGYPGPLVQSHLHGSFLAHTVLQWAGVGAMLTAFRWENRHYAVPGDVLTCAGEVTAVDGVLVTCALQELNQDDRLCAPAWATVRWKSPVSDRCLTHL